MLAALRSGPLAEREFRLLFTGQTMSMIGDGIAPIAIAFAVLDLTGSATDLGLVLTASYLPMAAFLLVGGVWADRLPRRMVMLASDAVRATTQAIAGTLLLTGGLVGLSLLQILAGVFDPPADAPVIPADVIGAMTGLVAVAVGLALALAERGLSRLSVVAALRER